MQAYNIELERAFIYHYNLENNTMHLGAAGLRHYMTHWTRTRVTRPKYKFTTRGQWILSKVLSPKLPSYCILLFSEDGKLVGYMKNTQLQHYKSSKAQLASISIKHGENGLGLPVDPQKKK